MTRTWTVTVEMLVKMDDPPRDEDARSVRSRVRYVLPLLRLRWRILELAKLRGVSITKVHWDPSFGESGAIWITR